MSLPMVFPEASVTPASAPVNREVGEGRTADGVHSFRAATEGSMTDAGRESRERGRRGGLGETENREHFACRERERSPTGIG